MKARELKSMSVGKAAIIIAEEIKLMHIARRISSDAGFAAIVREVLQKWRAAEFEAKEFWDHAFPLIGLSSERAAIIKRIARSPIKATQGKRGEDHRG